jgi:hypothetical protein
MRSATRPRLTAAHAVLIVLASVLLALLAAEGALRITGWCEGYLTDPLYRRSDAPGVSYELRPHAVGMAWGRTPVQTNIFGLRGPEITGAKPPGTIRIGIFGDSLTFGQGVASEETFAARVEVALRTSGRRVQVLNFGVPAYGITNIVSTFVEKAGPFGLDVAILAAIRDDYGFHRNHTADADGFPVRAETPLAPGWLKNVLRNLHLSYVIRDVVLAWRSTNEAQAGADYPRAVWERAAAELRRFAAVARARGTQMLYAHLSWADAPELGGVLAELGVPMIRMRPVLERYESRVLVVSRWDPHPNAFQHRLISDALHPAVEALLAGEGHEVTQPGG